jgi:hypothetical protein
VIRAAPAFVVLAISIGCSDNFADPDLWMHILVGLQILQTAHVPLRDAYSYSAAGSPWGNHEWLAQVAIAFSYSGLGIVGLKLLKLLCTAAVILPLATGLAQTAAPLRVQRNLLLAAAAALSFQIQFRPQVFTFVMLSILMAVLVQDLYARRNRLWPLIPIFALWANLHGGFVIGVAVLGTYSATFALRELFLTRRIVRAWRTALVTILCASATLINPLGTNLWSQVTHSVTDPVIRLFDRDWLPLHVAIADNWREAPLDNVAFVIPLILLVALVVSLIATPTLEDAPLVAVALVLIGSAFYSNRNVALAVIAMIVPLAHHLGLSIRRATHPEATRSMIEPHPLLITGVAVLIATAGGLFSTRLKTWEPVPSGALAFMSAHGLQGNILNDFDWGNYLIWHCAPRCRVFIDGRSELVYSNRLIDEYVAFLDRRPGSENILEAYPNDLVLIKPDTGAYQTLIAAHRWKLIYRDPVSALFVKTRGPVLVVAAPSPGKPLAPSLFP